VPEVFIRAGVTRWEIVLFALVVALGPAAVLFAVEVIVALAAGERIRHRVHLVFVAGLVLLIALHALRSLFGWEGALLLVAALLCAAGLVVAHRRVGPVRDWLRWLAPLPVVAVVLFLAFSPVADLVRGGAAPASAAVTVKARHSVVVLVLDEFPTVSLLDANGDSDEHRFPHFARLASDSTWFRNATSVGNYTHFAVPALLTGRYPTAGSGFSPTYVDYPDSLYRLLGGVYPVNDAEVVTRLCAPSYCRPPESADGRAPQSATDEEGLGGVLSRARDHYEAMVALHDSSRIAGADAVEEVDPTATTEPLAPAARDTAAPTAQDPKAGLGKLPVLQPTRFTDWMASITADAPPTLHVAHMLLPHFPWMHTSSGRTYGLPASGDPAGWADGAWVTPGGADLARRRLALQVGYVDRLLGTLVAKLKATKSWDDTVLVVTADHGEGVSLDGHTRELDDVNRTEILGVPLFVHGPGMTPGRDDRPAQNVDVVPTIAGLLGVRIPWRVDGRDLSQPATARPAAHPVGLGSDFEPAYRVESIDVSGYLDDLLALARERAVPNSSRDPDQSVLRTGSHGSLIGASLDDFATDGDAGGRVWRREFPDDASFADVAVEEVTPAYVIGTLDDGEADDVIVAAVNGRIAGTGDVVEPGDDPLFAMLLDPTAFRAGANDVRFYLWVDDRTLAPL
jgi:hypothetical protein